MHAPHNRWPVSPPAHGALIPHSKYTDLHFPQSSPACTFPTKNVHIFSLGVNTCKQAHNLTPCDLPTLQWIYPAAYQMRRVQCGSKSWDVEPHQLPRLVVCGLVATYITSLSLLRYRIRIRGNKYV